MEMCTLKMPYVCAKCGSDRLSFINSYGRLFNYKAIYNRSYSSDDAKNRIHGKYVKFMVCENCGKMSIIDWSGGFPKQLLDKQALAKFYPDNKI